MATLNKFNLFSQDLAQGVHKLTSGGTTYSIMLTNTAPVATNHLYGDISANEVANGNGYTTGGIALTITDSSSSGTEKVFAGSSSVWTATGAVGPFRYAVIYCTNSTPLVKPLVGWLDYGSPISLASGDTFTVSYDGTNGLLQVV